MSNKPTWNDLQNATQHELKKTYKLSDQALELAVRSHLDGASNQEMQKVYQHIYSKRR